MPFVIDNSVVCGWLIESQASPYSDAIAERLQDDTAHAPALWQLELTNVLRTACLRGRLTAQQAQAKITLIGTLPIEVDRQAAPMSELLALALRHGLSAYDAAYLELGLRLQMPLATVDEALSEAARACGVGVAQVE
jgi:predicted nucleic acid-binding protein